VELHGITVLRHQRVLGGVDRNPVEPGVEGAVPPELGQCPVCLDERLLCHVLRVARVPEIARNQLHYLVLVLAHQQVEGALVALLYPLDQAKVTGIQAHQTSQVSRTRRSPGMPVTWTPLMTKSSAAAGEAGEIPWSFKAVLARRSGCPSLAQRVRHGCGSAPC